MVQDIEPVRCMAKFLGGGGVVDEVVDGVGVAVKDA